MKLSFRTFGTFSVVLVAPLACSSEIPDLPTASNMCAEIGLDRYEFQPFTLAGFPGDSGSFEIEQTKLLVDDDDQTDDYPEYVKVIDLATTLLAENPEAVSTFAAILDPMSLTDEEILAKEFVDGVFTELGDICPRLAPGGDMGPNPGEDVNVGVYPYFGGCKDKFDQSGDGVIGIVDLDRENGAPQDAALSKCVTVSGEDNQKALNFWGPLTTTASDVEGLPNNPVDGFTYSGITVSVFESAWKVMADRSDWEGVAFWARLATAEEAVAIPGDVTPLAGAEIPKDARPQDGVGQIGVSIQTIDTISVTDGKGNVTEIDGFGVCPEGFVPVEGTPPTCFATQKEFDDFHGPLVPSSDGTKKYAFLTDTNEFDAPEAGEFCRDYVPTDAIVGEETPYRDQCWDAFRYIKDVSHEWRFYFFPFDQMRQAGWGRVGKSFRTDRIKSVSILTSAYQPINVMVDEVSYYRTKPKAAPEAESD